MSFTRARPFGFWVTASTVLGSEFEHLDDYAYAIDSRGGTYAPAALITIGGLGLTVTGPLIASNADTIDVSGALTILPGAQLSLNDNMVVGSGAIVGFTSGTFLTMSSGSTFTQNAGATATFSGAVTFNGNSFTVAEISSFTFPIYHSEKLYKNGAAATTVWRVTQINAALPAVTLDRSADTWWVNNVTSAGTTVYTVDHSTIPVAVNGERLSIQAYNIGATKDIDIIREDTSIIATIATGDGGIDIQFINGRWKLVGMWGTVTLVTPY